MPKDKMKGRAPGGLYMLTLTPASKARGEMLSLTQMVYAKMLKRSMVLSGKMFPQSKTAWTLRSEAV